MKYRVKIFLGNDIKDLEEKINQWIEPLGGHDILSISQSTFPNSEIAISILWLKKY